MTEPSKHPVVAEPPFLSYTALGRLREDEGESGDVNTGKEPNPYLNMVFQALTWTILAVVLVVWAVVGAVFWIPLLIRAMLRFCISLAEAMFEGQKPTTAARILKDAVTFYRRGFVVAVEVVTKEEVQFDEEAPAGENRLLKEFFWALFVWYFLALFFGWIHGSPMDLLNWFLSVPWVDHLWGLLDSLSARF